MNAKEEVLNADLYIEDGKIKKILTKDQKESQRGTDLFEICPPTTVLDAKNCWVLPGFIQTHVHLCQTSFRNLAEDLELLDWLKEKIWPMEGAHTQASLFSSASLGIQELLLGGTTTVLDMGTVHHTDEIFKAAQKLGIRLFCGKAMMDAGEETPKSLKEDTHASLDETQRLIETWHGKENGRLSYALAPRFALSCSEKLLKACHDLSEKNGIMIHTHASENRSECQAIETQKGKKTIHYLEDMGLCTSRSCFAHCIWVDESEMEVLKKTNTRVSHCPSSNLKLGSGIARVPELLKEGICVTLGADGAPCNNTLNMFQEMRLAGLIQKPRVGVQALPAKEILKMATCYGAKALHMENAIGSIETGHQADLILIQKDALHQQPATDPYTTIVYASYASDVKDVLVNGKVCVRNRKLLFNE
ncbi:MAG: hypothetical protein A3B70_08010 [Deltaproteobacteria bacterium RIFCSPHIGHO2_02_FULL_40_11]|nr:MAG: hypothetical protein A3B70_08010 [Deltaproteobacteria bacterium RIFCSPHIGHO2_02_FULL_40_11]